MTRYWEIEKSLLSRLQKIFFIDSLYGIFIIIRIEDLPKFEYSVKKNYRYVLSINNTPNKCV